MSEAVYLRRLTGYDDPELASVVAELLAATGYQPQPGGLVLVKPNLVAPRTMALACTTPLVVRAVCRSLLDGGARVVVADSPAFGTGRVMARLSGLAAVLADLPVTVTNLDRPRPVRLSFGGSIGVARLALAADHIVNVPRLKCHDQMGLTAGVKNLFGCVCGFRKSLAHQRFGPRDNRFARMILDVVAALPPVTTLLDGVVAMDRCGPTGGDPFPLGLLAAAANPVALDTALAQLLGYAPEMIPLWREARDLRLPGAFATELVFPLDAPGAFDAMGFRRPGKLSPIAFEPARLVKGRVKSLLTRLRRRA
jgi:uncharacterized protein (DUF362 family)